MYVCMYNYVYMYVCMYIINVYVCMYSYICVPLPSWDVMILMMMEQQQ